MRYCQRCRLCIRWLLLGPLDQPPLLVHYPIQFKALAGAVLCIAAFWAADFFTITLPKAERQASLQPQCEYEDQELTENASTLWIYFMFFLAARLFLSIPRVTAYVVDNEALTAGRPCRRYCFHILIHGPLYMFCVASALYCVQLVLAKCAPYNEALYKDLNLYATYSCMVSILCFVLSVWQDRLVVAASSHRARDKRRAPEGTLASIPTIQYDPALFGEGEDKLYHSECPICLMEWDHDDSIKVTSCGHAFHEACLGGWLERNRTCALCRRDLAQRTLLEELDVSRSVSAITATPRTATTRTATTSATRGVTTSADAGSPEPVPVNDAAMGVHAETIGMRIDSV